MTEFEKNPKPSIAAEIRVRQNQMSLSPEGRRALRWVIGEPPQQTGQRDELRAARLLRAVDEEGS